MDWLDGRSTDWLIDWLDGWVGDWSLDWLIDWLIDYSWFVIIGTRCCTWASPMTAPCSPRAPRTAMSSAGTRCRFPWCVSIRKTWRNTCGSTRSGARSTAPTLFCSSPASTMAPSTRVANCLSSTSQMDSPCNARWLTALPDWNWIFVTYQSVNQSINQRIDRSIIQLTESWSINQSINQRIERSMTQWTKSWSINQSIEWFD